MQFLSLDNILLLRRVIGPNQLSEEHAQRLAYIMKFLNKYIDRLSLKTLNMIVIYMYKKMSDFKPPQSLLDQLNLPEELKNAYRHSLADFSNVRYTQPIERDIDYLQSMYKETHNFHQTYVKEIPEGQRHYFDFLIDKTKQMKDLEIELFSPITQTSYLTIDSRDRDYDNDAAGKYRVFLNSAFKNVYAIEIISVEVPKSTYAVNEYNNIIHFQETNTQVAANSYYEAAIPIGNYTINELLPLIQSALNSAGMSSYMVTLIGDRVRITSDLTGGDNIFRLQFTSTDVNERYKEGSLGRVLGYSPMYKTGANAYTAESLYDLDYDHFALLYFTNLSRDNFQKIPLCNDDIIYFGQHKDYKYRREFYPPIDIDRLDVQWTDIDGNIMNFHGLPHSFTIRVDKFQ